MKNLRPMVKVRVLSILNCQATPPTISLIKTTAEETGLIIELDHIVVNTQEEAIEHRLIGSPTVQINGLDIEPPMRGATHFGLT